MIAVGAAAAATAAFTFSSYASSLDAGSVGNEGAAKYSVYDLPIEEISSHAVSLKLPREVEISMNGMNTSISQVDRVYTAPCSILTTTDSVRKRCVVMEIHLMYLYLVDTCSWLCCGCACVGVHDHGGRGFG